MRGVASARPDQGELEEGGASSGKHGAQAADEAARTELSPNQAEVPDDISLGDYASHSAFLPLTRDCKTRADELPGVRVDLRAPNQPLHEQTQARRFDSLEPQNR
jgi:hypothetical protein